jgi:hypothetical protein
MYRGVITELMVGLADMCMCRKIFRDAEDEVVKMKGGV